jgi:hypothetical protein
MNRTSQALNALHAPSLAYFLPSVFSVPSGPTYVQTDKVALARDFFGVGVLHAAVSTRVRRYGAGTGC